MKANTCALLLLVVAVGMWAAPARAQGSDTVVAGLGVGGYRFSQSDDIRASTPALGERSEAGSGRLYVEWYPQESFGVGLRYLYVGFDDYGSFYIPPTVYHVHRWVDVQNVFVTVQWWPFDPGAYARPGVLAGVGRSRYHVRYQLDGATLINAWASGTGRLVSVFLDMGAEEFGVRFGVSWLTTTIDHVDPVTANANGMAPYLDVRWNF